MSFPVNVFSGSLRTFFDLYRVFSHMFLIALLLRSRQAFPGIAYFSNPG
ncbi:MAG: hypothetical protein AAF217_10040 [Pseudomonadota bacterium]